MRSSVYRGTLLLSSLAFVALLALPSLADIPQVINFQGRVTDTGGTPIPDGTYGMRFSIYNVATGGTSLWYSGTVSVQVTDGIFNVLLGQSPQPAVDLPFDEDYWLSVWIEGDIQTPRQKLCSAGYAYMASGLVPGTEVSGSVTGLPDAAIKGTNTATSSTTYGVYGEAASTDGSGVYGQATSTTGFTKGVYGDSESLTGWGVYGRAQATNGDARGVFGETYSYEGSGVYGDATATTGNTNGVFGRSWSTSGRGVLGIATPSTGTTYGVLGQSSSPSGYGVYYSGGLAGTGTKSCVVTTSQGPTLLYCQESPENWFEDFGEGQLENGKAHVELDPLFLETVTIDEQNPLKVFVQLENEESSGLKVRRGLTSFDVENGSSHSTFWFRVVAKRRGFEKKRLDYCKAAKTDSYLYPELHE